MNQNRIKMARPQEKQAVRTTIVGGRPPGSGASVGAIPRGMEVLIKQAAVEPAFRTLLLQQRGAAAAEIGLALTPGESMMLSCAPRPQLQAVIASTQVSPSHRPALLGRAAAAMLAALGFAAAGCDNKQESAPRLPAPTNDPATQPLMTPGVAGITPSPATTQAADEPKIRVRIGATIDVPVQTQPVQDEPKLDLSPAPQKIEITGVSV